MILHTWLCVTWHAKDAMATNLLGPSDAQFRVSISLLPLLFLGPLIYRAGLT